MGDQDEESWRPSYMRRVGCVHIFSFGVFLTGFFFWLVSCILDLILPRRIACFSVHVIWKSLVCMIIFLSIYHCSYHCICSFMCFIITIGLLYCIAYHPELY